jgi:hypothetical protein
MVKSSEVGEKQEKVRSAEGEEKSGNKMMFCQLFTLSSSYSGNRMHFYL